MDHAVLEARFRLVNKGEAELRGSRFGTCLTARERRGRRRVLRRPWPASYAYLALRRVRTLAFPFLGGGRSTPARARFGEAERNSLLRRSCPVLALTNLVHLFAHELTGLRARRFARTPVPLGFSDCLLSWRRIAPFKIQREHLKPTHEAPK
jgi:hypothetical protein